MTHPFFGLFLAYCLLISSKCSAQASTDMESIKVQLEEISLKIKNFEDVKQSKDSFLVKSNKKYWTIFTKLCHTISTQFETLETNPVLFITLINTFIFVIVLLLCNTFLGLLISGFIQSKIQPHLSLVYVPFLLQLCKRIPEFIIILCPFWIKYLLDFYQKWSGSIHLKFIDQEISLISEITIIFLVGQAFKYLISIVINRGSFTLSAYIFSVTFIRVFKICIRFLLIITQYTNIAEFDYDISQIEAVLMFVIVISLLIQVRRLQYILPSLNKFFPYITGIVFISTLIAYMTNNQSVRFWCKLFVAILTWPLLLQFVSIIRNFSREYVAVLPSTSNEALRKPLKIWLIITNALRIFTIPSAFFIIIYIFDLNPLLENLILFNHSLVQRAILICLLYLFYRISVLVSAYISDIYFDRHSETRPFDLQRIRTSGKIIKYGLNIIIGIIVVLLLFTILGYNVAPLFQTIGLFSAAMTFSLQPLIRDLINGFCILYENSVKIGDWIDYEGKTAIIEDMSLRYIRARLDDGMLVTIPFHKLDIIKNKSRYHSYIVYNVSIARTVMIESVETAASEAFEAISERADFKYKIISKDLENRDIADVTGFSYVFQFRIAVQPQSQNKIRRALNKELLRVFEKYDIRIPLPMVANTLVVPSLNTGEAYPDFQ